MAFANRVLSLINGAVFLQIAGATAGIGGGTRPPLGFPEQIPDMLFIAKPDSHDNGFLTSAITFHTTYGLTNNEYSSIEELMDTLVKSTKPIDCMRIVTHAFTDFLAVKLFKNSSPGVKTAVLAGYAISDAEGLKATITEILASGHFMTVDVSKNVLFHLRSQDDTKLLLTPFGLNDAATAAPLSNEMVNYLRYCMDFMLFNPSSGTTMNVVKTDAAGNETQPAISTSERSNVQAALRIIIDDAAIALVQGSITAGQVAALQTALLGLTRKEMIVTTNPVLADGTAIKNLTEAKTAITTRKLRINIDKCRGRFTKTSRIDIRGCVIAKNGRAGLQAIQAFFGKVGNLPRVTGPDWYQGFPAGKKSVTSAEATTIFASGFNLNFPELKIGTTQPPPYKVTYLVDDVKDAFARWASLTHYNELLAYLSTQFSLSPTEFTNLAWAQKQTIVGGLGMPVLGMEAKRVDGLLTEPFADSIKEFRQMFRLDPAVPSTENRKKIQQLQPLTRKLLVLEKAINVAAPDPATQQTQLTELKTLYASIKAIAVTGINPPTTPVVPTDAQVNKLKQHATDLHTHLDTMLAKLYETFFADILAALALPLTPFLTYLSIGLPMLVENRKRILGPLDDVPVFHPSDSTLLMDHDLRNEALRSFLKTLWTGTPAQLAKVNTLVNQLQADKISHQYRPMLSESYFIDVPNEENGRSDAGFCPLVEYNNHIVVEPATP